MPAMDLTPIESLLSDLESADPAEAPDIADEIAERLSTDLEADEDDDAAPQA